MTATTTPSPPAAPARYERVRADAPDRLEASLVGAGQHVEAVLDVGTTGSGDLLLVLPQPAARLADLAAVPGWPTAGEAVTVLVPLAQALDRLHAVGVALTTADAAAVVLDAAGAAAWVVPDRPVLLRRAGAADFSVAVDRDLVRFHALAASLVQKAGGRLRVAAGADGAALVEALFEVADPVPVRLTAPSEPAATLPGRLLGAAPEQVPQQVGDGPMRARLRALAVPLHAVRRRVWAAAALVVVALLSALVLLPGRADADRAVTVPTRAASSAAARSSAPAVGPVAPKGLGGEQAVRRLLAARAACLHSGSVRCLTTVDATGSPVQAADRAALTAGTDPVLPRTGGIRVLSAGGGSVLAEVDGAVVAAVRQADGWRLRDVVAEPPG